MVSNGASVMNSRPHGRRMCMALPALQRSSYPPHYLVAVGRKRNGRMQTTMAETSVRHRNSTLT
eukprot:scaffold234344_cov15-Tisochrysis_lutea.AAC.1